MSRGENIAKIGFLIHDSVKRTSIIPALKLLGKSQYWSEDEMYSYRLSKLQSIVDHACKNVPYYKELFEKHNIHPSDIKSLDDIRMIPVLTKEIARENQERLISASGPFRYVKQGKTGGTTGVPMTIFKDTSDRTFAWASYYRWFNWMGIRKEERTLTFWGSKLVLKNTLKNRIVDNLSVLLENNRVFNSFEMSEDNVGLYYDKYIKADPVLIKGYVSALVLLAGYMKDNHLPANRSLRAVSGTSESLLPVHRELLEKVFGVPVYDQYGCGEASAISYECAIHKGLHINEEHVIMECLDDDDNPLVNKPGRVVVTTLDNYIMPFIRYDNGDIASIYSERCSCGVTSQLMSHVEGRTAETVTLKNGGKVHGVFFSDILYELNITTDLINRFQALQHKNGSVDFSLETNKKIPDEALRQLESSLGRFLDNVTIKIVPSIPSEENGKFLYIKTEK